MFQHFNAQLKYESPCKIYIITDGLYYLSLGITYSMPSFAASLPLTTLLATFSPPSSPNRYRKIRSAGNCYRPPCFLGAYNQHTGSSWSRGSLQRPRLGSLVLRSYQCWLIPHRFIDPSTHFLSDRIACTIRDVQFVAPCSHFGV